MRQIAFTVFALLLALMASACQQEPTLPEPSSEKYQETVSNFYVGVAAVQSGQDKYARKSFEKATQLAPGEPAAWANLGLLALRKRNFEQAANDLEKAAQLAPDNAHLQMLLGRLASSRGQQDKAIKHFRQAAALDTDNVKARYALAQMLEQQAKGKPSEEVKGFLQEVLKKRPRNTAVLLELTRVGAERQDNELVQSTLKTIVDQAENWPQVPQQQVKKLQAAASAQQMQQVVTQLAFLKNLLKRLPSYRQDLMELQTPAAQVGELVTQLIRLPTPDAEVAPPDTALAFSESSLLADEKTWPWVHALTLASEQTPTVLKANAQAVHVGKQRLPFPGGSSSTSPTPHGVVPLDVNYDFRVDLALVGAGGFRLYRQDPEGTFHDVTSQAKLPASITKASYTGGWAADIDMEGDIDLVLSAPDKRPVVLRNNGDGTFAVRHPFAGVTQVEGFAWADLDADGDPDAALVDAGGRMHLLMNERGGRFRRVQLPAPVTEVLALAGAELNNDGVIDLVYLQKDGALKSLSQAFADGGWQQNIIGQWRAVQPTVQPRQVGLFVEDLDNNGGLDLLASTPEGTQIWLQGADRQFQPLKTALKAQVFSVADLTREGRLDLVGLNASNTPLQLTNQGEKDYQWYAARPRAAQTTGDQRINSYGIGGEMEVRSGMLYQKQLITGPRVHFGLGTNQQAELMRVIWPNGSVQAEFGLESNKKVLTEQRLKGSCPWIFTYDGSQMRFVKDFLWRSGVGIRINAQETAGIMQTLDRVKIPGEMMAPRNGYYDLRITAELWESHFFDHVSLEVIDHPKDTEIFVDERFVPSADLSVHATDKLEDVAAVHTGEGQEVTDLVQARDRQYLGGFEMSSYQGLAKEHSIIVDLGEKAPRSGPLWLVAHGWLKPTDSSINYALSQGANPSPKGLSLEVPDGAGGWVEVRENIGFPAGKLKTVLVDLEDLFRPGTKQRLRLKTTAEVYWDEIKWAVGRPQTQLKTHKIAADSTQLRYRGFSRVTEHSEYAPEVPHYETIVGTAPRWRDLVGYYTRFGKVGELLAGIDDRYVIMNAGDEMVFRFKAPPAPPEGWTRDFVLVGDGWVKDGDYNTKLSKTVRPLPYHNQNGYVGPVGSLEEDPVYQRFPEDWQNYHTRFVGTRQFQRALADVQ